MGVVNAERPAPRSCQACGPIVDYGASAACKSGKSKTSRHCRRSEERLSSKCTCKMRPLPAAHMLRRLPVARVLSNCCCVRSAPQPDHFPAVPQGEARPASSAVLQCTPAGACGYGTAGWRSFMVHLARSPFSCVLKERQRGRETESVSPVSWSNMCLGWAAFRNKARQQLPWLET